MQMKKLVIMHMSHRCSDGRQLETDEPADLEDPELKALAQRLPATILHSRTDSTVKKYLGAFRRWKTWATSHNLVPIPAKPHEVALYLQHLGDKTHSKSPAEEACNALSWIHSSAGMASPSTHPFVKAAL